MMLRSFTTRSRRLVGALALLTLVGTGGAFLAHDTEAGPANHVEYTYYSSAAKTSIVGIRMLTCSGYTFRSGSVTPYFDVFEEPCP